MKTRHIIISVFVVCWLIVFHYESLRYFYLQPLFKKDLPKVKLLYPPAGWIMFFNVHPNFGQAVVVGIKDGRAQPIDPHQILQTRAIGYDNIYRNVLLTVLDQSMADPFCKFLNRKFSYFDRFVITYLQYPDVTRNPFEASQHVIYECPKN